MDAPFPTDVQEFDGDDRISYSKLDSKFIAVRDDGAEFEFDADRRAWQPIEEQELEENISTQELLQESQGAAVGAGKRRHDDEENGLESQDSKKLKPKNKKAKAPSQPRQNTAIYVTGLPPDATIEEVHELFSRKGGVIAEEIDSGAPRIKLYNDADGNFKGDALIVFFKPQSVEMAIMLLDDTDFRLTASGTREGRIRVQEADSSYKKVQYDKDGPGKGEDGSAKPDTKSNGNGNGERRAPTKDRKKIIKKTQKMDAKLADWSDDEAPANVPPISSKKDKMVVLQHMFSRQELEADPAALLEIKEDIRDECSKLGTVTSVVLYDEEEDGIVTVRFKDAESAMACINLMHGRNFGGMKVEAALATGKERFRKSKGGNDNVSD
ncbi:nuclear mRNA splicing factor-associated protein, putative [Cordyceps militaris CM01]|uniref:Nuclear mRNA splicing factor-associated protein, putative n=2 Tax=Cordyceps militaris TaxID=73501 RepID=G3J2R0_CORMM|nr:nuclear mRNA splicing factor-associated protein, putative [Cordyceps militaris CM01]ATY61972.1 nuclear mRNA splicing factor-associated [Cordyceps militaris]EGX96394.1 nuclear mRNA splicing factor-associated protein, putative [Cordyceps militaris CM01]